MEYIRETLPDGEELVLLDANATNEDFDPRRTALELRREALASQAPSISKPTGH